MNLFDKDAPLDMGILKLMAETYGPAITLRMFEEVLANWKKAGAKTFLQAWDEALAHYEGATEDEVQRHLAAFQLAFTMCGLPLVNLIPVPEVRDVDENGIGPLGDEYDHQAVPELIERGLAFNLPVLLRYPDRRLEKGNEVRFTETAVKMLEADLKSSVLPEDQWRQH